MHVGLDVERAARGEVLLGVSGVAVIRFRRDPVIEVVALADEHTAGIGCVLRDSVSI
jgi:hypothetical protein